MRIIVPLGLSLQSIRRFPLNTVMQMIEFVFASEQSDCSRATDMTSLPPRKRFSLPSAGTKITGQVKILGITYVVLQGIRQDARAFTDEIGIQPLAVEDLST